MKRLPCGWKSTVAAITGVAILSVTGCKRISLTVAVAAEPTPESSPVGEHDLTASPPITVPDLDRLLGVGFTVDEVVSEIERRGVLKLPDAAEREHVQRLPRGDRLLDTMERPRNLLTTAAVTRYGVRQAGAPNVEQWQAARAADAQQVAFQSQGRMPAQSVAQQQAAQYQIRRAALTNQINALYSQRQVMKRRGETTVAITMQIERLERERAALVPPL